MADFFANIAANGIGGRMEFLEEQTPVKRDIKAISLKESGHTPIKIKEKISTKEELKEELAKMRAKYAPFLENHAPEIKKLNTQIPLTEFDVDGEKITLPHYGGPSGYAKKVYTTEFVIDCVDDREVFTLKAILLDENDNPITYAAQNIEVFKKVEVNKNEEVELITNLQPGEYEIAGETVRVKPCGMLPVHFASRKTGHSAVAEFKEKDFSYWYNKECDMITPILYNTFEADGFIPILTSGNMDDNGKWHTVLACAQKVYNGKKYVICNVDLREENPIAQRFMRNIVK